MKKRISFNIYFKVNIIFTLIFVIFVVVVYLYNELFFFLPWKRFNIKNFESDFLLPRNFLSLDGDSEQYFFDKNKNITILFQNNNEDFFFKNEYINESLYLNYVFKENEKKVFLYSNQKYYSPKLSAVIVGNNNTSSFLITVNTQNKFKKTLYVYLYKNIIERNFNLKINNEN